MKAQNQLKLWNILLNFLGENVWVRLKLKPIYIESITEFYLD